MNKAFLFLLLILTFTAIALGLWYWQGNSWSKGALKLEILGPETLQAGDEALYVVKFKNNGQASLEFPELIFEYPENVVPIGEPSKRITKKLEDIYPGEERVEEFRARVFGKTGDTLNTKAWLIYKPKNLKASYESKTSLTTQITSVPITLEFDLPLKAEQGEDLQFSLNYFSNIDYVLNNLVIKVEYPNGFFFLYSKPQALDETEWSLPALYQVDGGRIDLTGRIEGNEGEQKIFKASLGMLIDDRFILLKESSQAVEIAEPSFYVSQLVNGSQNHVASVGDLLHYEIFFKNIGKKPIQKKFLFVKLEGDFFDADTLKSEKGEFGRGDNSIIWDWKNVSDLRFLDANEEGQVDFWINVGEGRDVQNPVLRNVVSIGGTEKAFENQINGRVHLAQKAYYQEEVFGNSGETPPKVGFPTTYTIFWQIQNSWNVLENVKVKSSLPKNVRPTGKIFPDDAKLTFDSASRELVWSVGSLEAFLGKDVPYSLAFQVELMPEESQQGTTAVLIQEAEITGEDAFTLESVFEKADEVNTSLPDDETISPNEGIIE